jgi:hypothetical protein
MRDNSISRRRLLAASALTIPLCGSIYAGGDARADDAPLRPRFRKEALFQRRHQVAADDFARRIPMLQTNGDEERYADRRASFSKTMPHNDFCEVDVGAYRAWLNIVVDGDSEKFEQVPRAAEAVERLNNPQAAYSIDLLGTDPAALSPSAPPAFASLEMAAEMAELYWLALLRDVPFRSFTSEPLVAAAIADLAAVGLGRFDVTSVFRSDTSGERTGPLVSQLLWHDVPYGVQTIEQRFHVPSRDQAFLTSFDSLLACQRGAKAREVTRFDTPPCYIASYRHLGEYVHRDFSFQAYMNGALIMLRMGGDHPDAVLSPTNPYRNSPIQFGDITFGNKNILSLLAEASLLAQKAAYYHKWQVHRRARPEVMGARIDAHLGGRKSYNVPPLLLASEAVARSKQANGSWLLPQAYPEGSPTHPSYPAAHAVNAGACATILKAFFDESYVIADPVEATADGSHLEPWQGAALTLGGEINKLAANIALARDAAGVHFRSDSVQGLKLGENVALALLAETSLTYSERFDGFVLTRFDGTKLQIANGTVRST